MPKATWFVPAGMGIVFATLTVLVLAVTAPNRWLGPGPAGQAPAKRTRNA